MNRNLIYVIIFCLSRSLIAQEIELYQQFNGRYDYTAIGNTLNLAENEMDDDSCEILVSSEATLNLDPNQSIVSAYLYWAGSGEGDFEITLNGIDIIAERTFTNTISSRTFFAAFTDVTNIINTQGNTNYTLTNLDNSEILMPFCDIGLNFAGWAIIIVYEDATLPINQVTIYDGLQSVPSNLSIVLDNLNIIDNVGAKIGFLAWEGDASLAVNEQLSINGNVLENPPLNPANNAFNGTNSFTGQSDLYNMDIDFYSIENNIDIGDTSAIIELTSGQDVVLVNNIVIVLNSQLPDATITIDNVIPSCASQFITLDFTIYNTNSTDFLPAGTPISFYIDNILIAVFATENPILIDGSESYSIPLEIPANFPINITLDAVADDQGDGIGIITELIETNNTDSILFDLTPLTEPIPLGTITNCNEGFYMASFNLLESTSEMLEEENGSYQFFETFDDLVQENNPILNPETYTSTSNPQTLYIKVDNEFCFDIYSIQLSVENCPPVIPQGFSPNNDGKNDWFNIQGLYNIFLNHELLIYNRFGVLIFKGNNDHKWFGETNKEFPNSGGIAPVGTYYYILDLNDAAYQPMVGWVYLNR